MICTKGHFTYCVKGISCEERIKKRYILTLGIVEVTMDIPKYGEICTKEVFNIHIFQNEVLLKFQSSSSINLMQHSFLYFCRDEYNIRVNANESIAPTINIYEASSVKIKHDMTPITFFFYDDLYQKIKHSL